MRSMDCIQGVRFYERLYEVLWAIWPCCTLWSCYTLENDLLWRICLDRRIVIALLLLVAIAREGSTFSFSNSPQRIHLSVIVVISCGIHTLSVGGQGWSIFRGDGIRWLVRQVLTGALTEFVSWITEPDAVDVLLLSNVRIGHNLAIRHVIPGLLHDKTTIDPKPRSPAIVRNFPVNVFVNDGTLCSKHPCGVCDLFWAPIPVSCLWYCLFGVN